MKKIISLLALLLLASCNSVKIGNEIKSSETGTKIDNVNISTGNISTGSIEKSNEIDKLDNKDLQNDTKISSGETEEKDSIVVIDDNNDNELDGKTQEEVVDEMGDYVNDLFNMIEEDVK